jgi:prophage regulatory protein
MRNTEFQQRLREAPAASLAVRDPEDEVFVPFAELSAHGIPYTRVHLRRLVARGLFPRPVQLSANRIAWTTSALAAWKASRPTAALPAHEAA